MRKPQPIELELSISDNEYFQNKINSIFVDIIKYTLDNSSATTKEKISYLNKIISNIKTD